jgi:photosynthetic reaction center H subunit
MPVTGAVTSYIDVAQLALYGFWLFFGCLIFYLRREDKREGYPCESDRSERSPRVVVQGFPAPPSPKTFLLTHGGTYQAPGGNPEEIEIRARPVALWPGAPLQPTGNPMTDAVGPAAYALRADEPDLTVDGDPRITPMRASKDVSIAEGDPDPRGMEVVGADRVVAGTVKDVWVDHTEPQARYLEVELADGGGKSVLLPVAMARVNAWRRQVKVRSILAHQFADVPALKNPHQVTKREEDKITAYYAGGTLYADPSRLWPAL